MARRGWAAGFSVGLSWADYKPRYTVRGCCRVGNQLVGAMLLCIIRAACSLLVILRLSAKTKLYRLWSHHFRVPPDSGREPVYPYTCLHWVHAMFTGTISVVLDD